MSNLEVQILELIEGSVITFFSPQANFKLGDTIRIQSSPNSPIGQTVYTVSSILQVEDLEKLVLVDQSFVTTQQDPNITVEEAKSAPGEVQEAKSASDPAPLFDYSPRVTIRDLPDKPVVSWFPSAEEVSISYQSAQAKSADPSFKAKPAALCTCQLCMPVILSCEENLLNTP